MYTTTMTQNVTLDRWMNLPAAFVVDKVRENFEFFTGQVMPTPKAKTKNVGMTDADWFRELSFVHLHIWHFSTTAAKARGLLSPAEAVMVDAVTAEIDAILSEG